MKTLLLAIACLWVISATAAVPTFGSFNTNQFDTNGLRVNYRAVWTNEVGVAATNIHPAQANSEVTVTNFNLYETFILPAKVTALSLGTNELNVATNTSWLLSSPTNDASQVILSLSAGKFQGQLLLLTSQNDTGSFTLPNASEQYDVPGAFVYLQGIDWTGTTNRGMLLQYVSPDWVEMARFGSTGGPIFTNTPGGGGDSIWTNIAGVVQMVPGQTATNTLSFTSGAPDNLTNIVFLLDTADFWTGEDEAYLAFANAHTNFMQVPRWGGWTVGRDAINQWGGQPGMVTFFNTTLGEPSTAEYTVGVTDNGSIYNYSSLISSTNSGACALKISAAGGTELDFTPGVASTGSAVAYKMDTSNVLTNDDRIALFGNNGADRFSINYDGSVVSQDLASGNFLAGPFQTLENSTYSAIVGGDSHIITNNVNGSIIAGGHANQVDGSFSAVVGGARNVNFGDPASIILGGEDNNITSNTGYSAILAGDTCTINTFSGSDYFTILGGQANQLRGNSGSAKFYANIWGGHDNVGSASSTWIIGNNITNSTASTIQMGLSNAKKVVIDANGAISISGKTNLLADDGTRYLRDGSPLITFVYPVAVTDQTTSISVTTNLFVFRSPFAFTLTDVRASLRTAQASGSTFTVYFSESGTSVLSTPVTIDNGEKTSVTAAVPAVISDSSIADDAELSISVSNVGDGSAVGLLFEFYGYQ